MRLKVGCLFVFIFSLIFSINPLFASKHDDLQLVTENEGLSLPSNVIPFHQLLHLQPFYNGTKSTKGYTEISFRATEAISSISFHIAGLVIDESSAIIINQENLATILPNDFYYTNNTEMVTANLNSEALQPGPIYIMTLNFTATLNANLFGFYESFYTDEDKNQVDFAVSQFAPIYARWSFPCFDEPAMKVKFSIQIETPNNLTAISNMPIASTQAVHEENSVCSQRRSQDSFRRLDIFEDTPIMSTYLVAFLVADFVTKTVVVNDVTYGVWTTRSGIVQAEYALSLAPKVIGFYDSYMAIPYSSMMPKLDMAAVPDFYFGAMENWGLVIYRESSMLYDNELSSAMDKQVVCSIIAHELAHMWFGNLVTFQWWNDVWLNEGFATFLEYVGCNAVEPTFGVTDQFLTKDLYRAFAVDSLATSKPLSPEVTQLNAIYNVYNTIAYSKGAAIIRMMEYFLTPSTFQNGLHSYLERFSYSNAQHDDLWDILTDQGHADETLDANLSMKEIMEPWTIREGYPVLMVEKYDNGTVYLTQKRFLEKANSTLEDVTWFIPLTYVTQDDPDFSQTQVVHWMTNSNMILPEDSKVKPDQWIIFNVQQNGYYRVNYDIKNWNKLITQFQEDHTLINTLNRAQILDDGYSLAKIGALDYDTILSINAYLGKEDSYVPMQTALDRLNYLYIMLLRTSSSSSFKDYMLSLVVPIYNYYGFEDSLNDPHSDQLKRALIVDWACKLDHADCTSEAIDIYADWITNPSNNSIVSPNLRSSVYCTAIAHGSEIEWDFAYERYLTSNIANQRKSLIYGMGCTYDERLINRYMNWTFVASSGIKQQDVKDVFRSLAENLNGRDLAWEYIQTNTDSIATYMGSYQSVIDLVDIVVNTFNTEENLLELQQYESDESANLGLNSLDHSEEVVENNIEWMNVYFDVISDWLTVNGFLLK